MKKTILSFGGIVFLFIFAVMELTPKQKGILNGKICPYCKGETILTDSKDIYSVDYGKIYLCKPCDAYVGCHKGTTKALGRLANKELRHWKKEAHKYFDMIWGEAGGGKRKEVYKHLSTHLGLPTWYTHIGMFSVDTCKEVVDWSKMILNDLRRLDMDFGADVKRPHFER